MYSINDTKYVNKGKVVDTEDLIDITGFLMGSKNKVFKIGGADVREIKIVNKKLANPLVSKKVSKKFDKLIVTLTELLVDDDDSGESFREALNQIERFRVEIKNKYREYLKQKELEKMSKKLVALQKAANARLIEVHNSYMEYINESKRSK